MKKLSIIIPNYNQDTTVLRAVQSTEIYDQDDIEIIVVDDHSSLSIYNNLQELLTPFRNVKLVRNEVNLGLVQNWNKCIQLATGEWLGLMCCDDEYHVGALKSIYNRIKSLTEPLLIIQDRSISPDIEYCANGVQTARRLKLPLVSGNFWHREITDKLGGFDERLKYSPDAEFWFRIALNYPVLKIEARIAIYHQHEHNYMWETWGKPDFIQQIRLLSSITIPYCRPEATESEIKKMTDEGVHQTLLTILHCTIGKKNRNDIFSKYFEPCWQSTVGFRNKFKLSSSLVSSFIKNAKEDLFLAIRQRVKTSLQNIFPSRIPGQ